MMHEPRRIAVFRMGHIGDTIIALPALWTVRKRFPRAKILYLAQEHGAGKLAQGSEVLRPGTVFDEKLVYTLAGQGVSPLQILKTLLQLRLKRIDMLVYLPPFRTPRQLNRDEKFFRLAGIKTIVGMQGYRETNYRPEGSPLPCVRHEADTLLSHLERDGILANENPIALMDLGLSDEEKEFGRRWLADQGIEPGARLIGMGPGSKMPAKLWPIERFVQLVRRIDARFHPTFLLFGSASESEVCRQVCQSVSRSVNTAGKLTIRESAAVFAHCGLYVGNDTGTMHIAAAAGVPCIGLFSARDWPGRWYPYGPGHSIHRVAVPCEGCMLEVCDKDNLCLHLIGTDAVFNSVADRLSALGWDESGGGGASNPGMNSAGEPEGGAHPAIPGPAAY